MVDDFVMDAVGLRKAPMNVHDAARFTLPGIWAYQSAQKSGLTLEIPQITLLS
jgi:hypothetical protein